jgi:hypothetical protein
VTVTTALAVASLVIGLVYAGFGVVTLREMRRADGAGPSAWAWVGVAFTCGAHHLVHAVQLAASGRDGGSLELMTVVAGVPAAVIWLVLRVEAGGGGRGDRVVTGEPPWLRVLVVVAASCAVVMVAALIAVVRSSFRFPPYAPPSVLLVVLYAAVGWHLLRVQLSDRAVGGHWSLSGLALTAVFPTCALMHAAWGAYLLSGQYRFDMPGFVTDWLAVPAAFFFLWTVRSTEQDPVADRRLTAVVPETV